MHSFKDTAGRVWEISLTIGTARRIKNVPVGEAQKPIDLIAPEHGDPPALTRLATDNWAMVDLLFLLVKPQAELLGVSDEQFGESLGAEAFDAAQAAFWGELEDFFQRRPDIVTAIRKQTEIIQAQAKRIESMDAASLIDAAMPGKTSGMRPELSELIHSP